MSGAGMRVEAQADRLDDVSIVVLSYNRREELMRNLAVLCELHVAGGAELIVVDNNSTDGTRGELDALAARFPSLKVILSGVNLGVAAGRNAGWAAATRQFILNVDDDTRIDMPAVRGLRDAALQIPRGAILTPKILHAETGECQNGYGDNVKEPANFHGACHLLPTKVAREVGVIDPQCTFGGEELDYSIRARVLGYPTVFLSGIRVRHNSLPRKVGPGKWRRQRWVYNFCRIHFKYFPIRHASLFLARFLVAQVASAASGGDARVVPSLLLHAARGMVNGRQNQVQLPRPVLDFYTNTRLVPDFGNRSMIDKLRERLVRSA
jgi:GT2 family glycosyltransferase